MSEQQISNKKTLVNVLGVVYVHVKNSDGGDLYLTRFSAKYHELLDTRNWYEKSWFDKYKIRLKGTGSVFKVPTKMVNGHFLDLVVKNCRVGEDVPLDTHTLQEFCDAEFNSPWEEFSLVEEMREGAYGPKELKIKTQLPLAIYVPPEVMQMWQSGRSRSKINRIRAKHPGIDLDILKQYKLIYCWINGYNLPELFEQIDVSEDELKRHLAYLDKQVMADLDKKGYLVADTKPEHIIIEEEETDQILEIGRSGGTDGLKKQIDYLYNLIKWGNYSLIDYELLLRTPKHEEEVKNTRRHSYLDDQRDRFTPTPIPDHLHNMEIFGVPYIYGHAESTGGHLWVVGKNARLFDYFLPERWRKTPAIRLSKTQEVFYTLTKDNIHLVWETSKVGEIPEDGDEQDLSMKCKLGINSPFEEFAIAHDLSQKGIPCTYVRAIYMTGSLKIEKSTDCRRYESHKQILTPEEEPILQEDHNFITIRGYFNGPDEWVAEQTTGPLYKPIDLIRAVEKGLIDNIQCLMILEKVKKRLKSLHYNGSLLKPGDLLLVTFGKNQIVKDNEGEPLAVICDFKFILEES